MPPLRCPVCPDKALAESAPRPGLAVDCCPGCGGAWLDIGEVYAFTRDPQAARDALKAAYGRPMPTTRRCPRCARPLAAVRLEAGGILVEACRGCGGNWFDRGELARFVAALEPPPGPRAAAEGPSARPLSDAEAARLAGPDPGLFVALAVGLCGALALGVLWVLRGRVPGLSGGALPFLVGACAVPAAAALAARAAAARARRLRGAWLVPGSVTGRRDSGSIHVELAVSYPFGDAPRVLTARVDAGGPLDAAVGARAWVAVRPDAPDEGVLVSPP